MRLNIKIAGTIEAGSDKHVNIFSMFKFKKLDKCKNIQVETNIFLPIICKVVLLNCCSYVITIM